MNLGDLGEFGLIRRIAPHFHAPARDVLGIGDDCAVLPKEGDRVTLVTTDLLIENIHFLRDRIAPEELGHKALAVNLSDIAAMGGWPTAAFLSVGLPETIDIDWLDRFFAGIKALGETTGCALLGGDTTKSDETIIINFAVLGEAIKGKVKHRSGARAEDIIAVTGVLGDSGAGLRLLLEQHPLNDPDRRHLVEAHHRPFPHLKEGQWLAAHEAVHAMMDVSDGIDSDIRHVMEQSGLGATVDVEALPVSRAMVAVCNALNWPVHELAATGGEDYCLLCTVDARVFDRLAADFAQSFGKPLTAIGTMEEGRALRYRRGGDFIELKRHGYDHFKTS